jgi:hypothetical protein
MEVTLKITGAGLADPTEALKRAWRPALQQAVMLTERGVRLKTPLGVTGIARGSTAGELREAGGQLGLPVGLVGSPLPYVQVVNDGRRPGQKMPADPGAEPPAAGLLLWVKRKIRIEEPAKRRRRNEHGELVAASVKRRATDEEAMAITWAIARAIARRGTKPVGMYEATVQENAGRIGELLAQIGMQFTTELTRAKG